MSICFMLIKYIKKPIDFNILCMHAMSVNEITKLSVSVLEFQ